MTTSDWTAKCDLCPRNCLADRNTGLGTCRSGDMITVAKSMLHFWEEPCISGKEGSGAVFFSGCALHCVYCQNNMISEGETGERISVNRLTEMFFCQQRQGFGDCFHLDGVHVYLQFGTA